MQTFGDLELAAKTKEVISTLVRKEVESLRPAPRYATVSTLDPVTVTYDGDPTAMPVRTGSVIPTAVGQIVRIEGPLGDRYIADVVGAKEGVPLYDPTGSSTSTTTTFPDGIFVGPDGQPITGVPPGTPTTLTITQGLEFENIYVMVSWDLVSAATEYDVEIAEKLGANVYSLKSIFRVAGTTARIDNLIPFTEYGVRITAVGNTGLRGASTVWHDFITTGDNTIPPQVGAPSLSRGATTMVVTFTGLTDLEAPDVANGNGLYEVQIDTVNTFDGVNLRTSLGASTVVAFADLTFSATWFARVRAIDSSGNLGSWSLVSSLVAGAITSDDIDDGAIKETHIADAAISTPKLQANAVIADKIAAGTITGDKIAAATIYGANIVGGTITGDKIAANTISTNKLSVAVLTATTSVTLAAGGQLIIGNPTYRGIIINNQGITAYKDYNTTFHIDSSGNATFGGSLSAGINISSPTISGGSISSSEIVSTNFHTSKSGARVEIYSGQSGGYQGIRINDGNTTYPDPCVIYATNSNSLLLSSRARGGNITISSFCQIVVPGTTQIYSGGYKRFEVNGTSVTMWATLSVNGSVTISGNFIQNGSTLALSGHTHNYASASHTHTSFSNSVTFGHYTYHNARIFASGMLSSSAGGQTVRWYTGGGAEVFRYSSSLEYKDNVRYDSTVKDEYLSKALGTPLPTWEALTDSHELNAVGMKQRMADRPADRGTVKDRVGPILEEMVNTWPEAVLFDEYNKPVGIDESLIASIMWHGFQKLVEDMKSLRMINDEWPLASP